MKDGIIYLKEFEAELMRDDDEATTTMPPPPSTSGASARVPSLIPPFSPPPCTSSCGGHVPSGSGRATLWEETPRRPPRHA